MPVVWNWIKWGAVIAIIVLFALLKGSCAEIETLQTKLDVEKSVNQTSQKTIKTLRSANSDMNKLLVARQRQHNQTEAQLDADISELKQQLANKKCYSEPWPDDVTRRLREPY